MSVGMTVHLKIKPEMADDFEQFFLGMIKRVKASDEGCELYDLFRGVEDSSQFILLERWASQEALDAHGKQPHMKTINEGVGARLAGRPGMHRHAGD